MDTADIVAAGVIAFVIVAVMFTAVDYLLQGNYGPDQVTVLDRSYSPGYTTCDKHGCDWHDPTFRLLVRVNDRDAWGAVTADTYAELPIGAPACVWWRAGRISHWTYIVRIQKK